MANFAPTKLKKVQRLVKIICSMLLMILALTEANDIQKNTEPQEAMPQMPVVTYIHAKPSTSQDTMGHLFTTQWAVPIYLAGELPGYHPHHSKPKCLQSTHRQDYNCIHDAETIGIHHQRTTFHHHVIDYYIYTLEHILI
jgi:hypothetical protein